MTLDNKKWWLKHNSGLGLGGQWTFLFNLLPTIKPQTWSGTPSQQQMIPRTIVVVMRMKSFGKICSRNPAQKPMKSSLDHSSHSKTRDAVTKHEETAES